MPLILNRKPGEKILLKTSDGLVEILMHGWKGQSAELYVTAPPSIDIVRDEIENGKLPLPPIGNRKYIVNKRR